MFNFLLWYFWALVLVAGSKNYTYYLSDEFINRINDQHPGWVAGKTLPRMMTEKHFKSLLGTKLRNFNPENIPAKYDDVDVRRADQFPDFFDARKQWPHCSDVIGNIRNQGACGSCWAFSTTSVMSSRMCISSHGKVKIKLSPEDVLTCCPKNICGERCQGGYTNGAWTYWQTQGIVSGGDAPPQPAEGCKPYSPHSYRKSIAVNCEKRCTNPRYATAYEDDKVYGGAPYRLRTIPEMQQDLMTRGPIVAYMENYPDFMVYTTGVYRHVAGFSDNQSEGGHFIVLIGWGVEADGTEYWLGVNSWGPKWGLGGLFKFAKGVDSNEIESKFVMSGDVEAARSRRARGGTGRATSSFCCVSVAWIVCLVFASGKL